MPKRIPSNMSVLANLIDNIATTMLKLHNQWSGVFSFLNLTLL
jgi:hypothetical protein